MRSSNDMRSSDEMAGSSSNKVTTDVPVFPEETSTDSAPEDEITEETLALPETTEETPTTTDSAPEDEITEETLAAETTEEIPETSEETPVPETIEETSAPVPTEDISLTDIDVDKTSNITEIIEDLFSTGTGTVTGTMTATFAPQEVVSDIISNIEPEATDAVSIETLGPIINVT